MSGNEPTTGWEAQAWDPPAQPADAEQERTDRLARLVPSADDADEALADPVVPDEVETTVPIGAPVSVDPPEPELDPEPEPERTEHSEPMPLPPAETAAEPSVPSSVPADAWRDLQVQFVDDPGGAVEGAVALVRQAVDEHAGATGSADTEQLRRAFTRLRDLHARLVD